MRNTTTWAWLGAAVLAMAYLTGCGTPSNADGGTPDAGTVQDGGGGNQDAGTGFPKPAGTVAVNFSVDDSANKVFAAGNLEWKGSFTIDPVTRKITKDSTWGGPYPKLYDDGPYTGGGHEPANAVAGDNKWGVTVFATPPATAEDTYEYGLNDSTMANGWIWKGTNGTFKVAAGATADINATGMVLAKFGTTDVKFTLNKNNLGAGTWTTAKIEIKGSAWAWTKVELKDDGLLGDAAAGDGIYTFILSNVVGAGKQFPHLGLVNSGDNVEFIYELDAKEYKDANGQAHTTGCTGATKPAGGSFTTANITIATNKNTQITVP